MAKIKVGDKVSFKFAGQSLIGEIKAITVDKSYSVPITWYKILHDDGTMYPMRSDSIVKLSK